MIKVKLVLFICVLLACCDLCLASATERYQVKVNTHLNIRSGPGSSYKSVGTLQNGSYVNVVSFEG